MSGNLFTKPSKLFKTDLEDISILKVLLVILSTAILTSGLVFIISNNFITSFLGAIFIIVQWLVISIIYWIFEFLFTTKKKHAISSNFLGIINATSSLWILMLISTIFFYIALIGGIFSTISAIIILIISIFFIIDSYLLMKVLIDSGNLRAFIAWILSMIIFGLLMNFAGIIANLIV